MKESIEQIEYRGNQIKILLDDYPSNPRRESQFLSKMVCFHRRYSLGDDHDYNSKDYNSWDEVERAIVQNENPVLILPLYLYDHSGLRIKIGSFYGFLPQGHARFDSGQVGFIFISLENACEFLGAKYTANKKLSKKQLEKIEEFLQNEVEVYDQYLSGDVYGVQALTPNGEEIWSCWGFFGEKGKSEGIREAKESIEQYLTTHA